MMRARTLVVLAFIVLAVLIAAAVLWARSSDVIDLAMLECRLCHE